MSNAISLCGLFVDSIEVTEAAAEMPKSRLWAAAPPPPTGRERRRCISFLALMFAIENVSRIAMTTVCFKRTSSYIWTAAAAAAVHSTQLWGKNLGLRTNDARSDGGRIRYAG